MAIASELNVYRDTYRLTQFLLVITKQFDKIKIKLDYGRNKSYGNN